jgi:hypothetical protein
LDRKVAPLFYFLNLIKPFELKAALTAQRFAFASFVDPSLAPAKYFKEVSREYATASKRSTECGLAQCNADGCNLRVADAT